MQSVLYLLPPSILPVHYVLGMIVPGEETKVRGAKYFDLASNNRGMARMRLKPLRLTVVFCPGVHRTHANWF